MLILPFWRHLTKNVKTCHTAEIFNFVSFASKFSKINFSKSNLPIGSARTQRSDIQAQPIKQGTVQNLEKCEFLSFNFWQYLTKICQNLPYDGE